MIRRGDTPRLGSSAQTESDMGRLKKLVGIWNETDLLERILEEGSAGVPETGRGLVVAGLAARAAPLVVVLPRGRDAESFAASLGQWMDPRQVSLFPAWEALPGEAVSPTLDTMGRRIRTVRRLARGEVDVLVTSVRGLLQRVGPAEHEEAVLAAGTVAALEEITELLVAFGYERNYLVERSGEFSVRGGILDVFPPGSPPVRADFFGDEIVSLKTFSVSSQRSLGDIDKAEILPARELRFTEEVKARALTLLEHEEDPERRQDLERIAGGLPFPGMEAFLPLLVEGLEPITALLDGGGKVVLCDPKLLSDRAADFLAQAREWSQEPELLFASFEEAIGKAEPIELWAFARGEEGVDLDASGWEEYAGRPAELAATLRRYLGEGTTVAVCAGRSAERAREVLAESDLGLPIGEAKLGEGQIVEAEIERGLLLRLAGRPVLALVGRGDLFGKRRPAAPRRAQDAEARPAALLLELAVGDFVVHELYGVGRYLGMVTRDIAGVSRDYLLIEYSGDDRLYVPTEQLDAVTKYSGGETPRLNRLGTAEWEKAKNRARRAVKEIAEELVVLYAKRTHTEGHSFADDTPWQRQLEDAFPYLETPDQQRAIEDVKRDMELARAMDRLICGDVGYGKTEIAIRAAFKAVQDSKQVAVLVPTTILAQQHTNTFRERFQGFPLEVVHLSRFLTDREQREALELLASGRADVVIGTHRLLQSDVKFNDLGLLVVDEEQRFGVRHKETIKRLRESVDVLTLSATPIPRTLEMCLTGIRDMSLVDTPPPERRPVLTYVGAADDRMITAAIKRELAREGQVFYVHNRVRTIRRAARRIAALAPGARVEIAHGQMSEADLERVMVDVWEGKVDVLVCTTIIESGLDIPAMNTLIVERADLLGLAQLYQLRGRVGRAGERAYAYFLYPEEAYLTDEAHERLKTLSEFTELGSGFKIALRDLEIRGAGNLLGAQQSGHIAAVGFDLYVKMMAEAVSKLSGKVTEPEPEVRIDLPVDAFIPASYIGRESLRIEAYRRIEKIRNTAQAAEVREELTDRYGPIPPVVENLLLVAEIRAMLAEHGIREASARDGVLKLRPFPPLLDSQQVRLRRLYPRAVHKETSETLLLPVPARDLASWVHTALGAILEST